MCIWIYSKILSYILWCDLLWVTWWCFKLKNISLKKKKKNWSLYFRLNVLLLYELTNLSYIKNTFYVTRKCATHCGLKQYCLRKLYLKMIMKTLAYRRRSQRSRVRKRNRLRRGNFLFIYFFYPFKDSFKSLLSKL